MGSVKKKQEEEEDKCKIPSITRGNVAGNVTQPAMVAVVEDNIN